MKTKPIQKKSVKAEPALPEKKTEKPTFKVTKAAVAKLLEVAKQAKMEGKYVRVFAAHGCCGMQYGMDFDDNAGKNDRVFIENGIKLVIEKSMVDLLSKATIDYVKSEHTEGFRIDNPYDKKGDSCEGSCDSSCQCS